MKKFFLLATAMMLLPLFVSAQSVSIGVKGGLNMSTFGGEDANQAFQSGDIPGLSVDFDPAMRTAFVAGGFVTIQLDDYFALQPELLYVSRGVRYNDDGSVLGVPFTYDVKLKVNYLEIPVLAKLTIPTGTPAIPFLYAGPSIGLKVGKATTDGTVTVMGQETDISDEDGDSDSNFKSSDFGVAFGGGLGLKLGGGMLSFDARYTLGLSTIMKPQTDNNGDEVEMDIKNRSLALTLGFSFFL